MRERKKVGRKKEMEMALLEESLTYGVRLFLLFASALCVSRLAVVRNV